MADVADPATVLLIRHSSTQATRRHTFAADEPLDREGWAAVAELRNGLSSNPVISATTRRCRQTAGALFPDVHVEVDARWDELRFGDWAGKTFDEVSNRDGDTLSRWLSDPAVAPPGGEPLTDLATRVTEALDALARRMGTIAVCTSAGPIKVAIARVLGAPLEAVWRIEVAPCSITTLRHHPDGGWALVTGTGAPA